MDKKELIEIWRRFTGNTDFELNSDTITVERLAEGVLSNENSHGLKLCPCKLRKGTREDDLMLLCPCNFKIQDAWKEREQCWCSLFIKKSKA